VVEESPPKVLASGAASVGINATIVEDLTRAEDFVHRRCGTVFVRQDDPFILEEMGATAPPEEHEYLVCPVLPERVKSIYKIDVLVLDGKVQRHEFARVDTCSSSKLIDAAAVPAEVDVPPCSQPGLTDASRNTIFVEGLARIPLRIGNLQTVLPMYVMKSLQMPILLGTPCVDRYVESIRPQSRQIKLVEGSAVAILNNDDKAAIVRVTELAYLAPLSETVVR
jgi:hypothetical protein